MRIDITGQVWDSAALALGAGNHTSAGTYSRLAEALTGTAGMAGDDATSTEFSASYDEAAPPALNALADLVDSFATLARLTRASISHHRGANAGSVLRAPAQVYDPGSSPAAHDEVTVRRTTPPSSLGADSVNLPHVVTWVLDQVQGFAWPNADTDRLRAAGRAWTAAADEVGGLDRHCLTARRSLQQQRSPEVPTADAACADLSRTTTQLAGHLRTIGHACTSYARAVDTQRHAIIELVEDLVRDAVIVEGIGIVLGAFTAGLTAAGAAALNAAKIAAAAPRIIQLLEALTALARGGASMLRVAHTALGPLATTLGTLKGAHVLVFAAQVLHQVPAVGPLNPASFPPLPTKPAAEIDLDEQERAGGHTLEKHVGKTDEELADRFGREPDITGSSSFPDRDSAERLIQLALGRRADRTAAWLRSARSRSTVDVHLPPLMTGRYMTPEQVVDNVSGVRIVLVRDPTLPSGFRIQTAFPIP